MFFTRKMDCNPDVQDEKEKMQLVKLFKITAVSRNRCVLHGDLLEINSIYLRTRFWL